MEQDNKARALFVSQDGDSVKLLLLPGQSLAFQGMLWRCAQPFSGLFCATATDDSPLLNALDEVEVACSIGEDRKKTLVLEAITRLRTWQDVVQDEELRQRLRAEGQWMLLSSARAEQVILASNKTAIFCNGEELKRVNLHAVSHNLLHAKLFASSGGGTWADFMRTHPVPFHVLVSTEQLREDFSALAIQWEIDSYLERCGIQLSHEAVECLADHPKVHFPQHHHKMDLWALCCPSSLNSEDLLIQAARDGTLQCCALFAVPPIATADGAEAKNKKAKK
jgi:hypothetical protein